MRHTPGGIISRVVHNQTEPMSLGGSCEPSLALLPLGRALLARLRETWERLRLPAMARAEMEHDRLGLPLADPGPQQVLDAVMEWLARAQDCSHFHDGGVARDYSLIDGWASSYPETTGYIVPTFIEYARQSGRAEFRERARRMADWLVSIQLPSGAFQGGKIDSIPVVPVTFNTGQILIGLAAAQAEFGTYREPMRRAADWLVETQDDDGCWRDYPTPFAAPGEKEYETHVAWGLFEAARLDPGRGYGEAGSANVRWALSGQHANGWFARCCLDDATRPLSHTIGYVLRGLIEGHRFSPDPALLDAARRTADSLLGTLGEDGSIPGRLRSDWSSDVGWVCLTGSAQLASCWLLLFECTGDERYMRAAWLANRFLRRTVRTHGPAESRGAVKGAFPVDGGYGRFQFLNWAAKFLADSLMLEMRLRARTDLG